ncbi:MAG: glycosyltransferase family 2 protein [Rhodospirillales bacterium]|nr:glycosyltransferase family 2 protein [Rhodospirillales bacterium]
MAEAAPCISVLITTHNGGALLDAAIASILTQDAVDFELIVVDDASTDDTPRRLAAHTDPRLRVLRNDRNLGVVGARNRGFAACRGAFLATLDHDDLAAPGRLAAQYAALRNEPGLVAVACGTAMLRDGRLVGEAQDQPLAPDALGFALHLGNPLTYSAMMLRMAALRRLDPFVRAEAELADDYDLYHRLLALGPMRRIAGQGCLYRWHADNLSARRAALLDARARAILAAALARLPGLAASAAGLAALLIRYVSNRDVPADAAGLRAMAAALEQVLGAYLAAHPGVDPAPLAALAGREWWRMVAGAARAGQPGLLRLRRSAPILAGGFILGPRARAETLLVSLLRRATRR